MKWAKAWRVSCEHFMREHMKAVSVAAAVMLYYVLLRTVEANS